VLLHILGLHNKNKTRKTLRIIKGRIMSKYIKSGFKPQKTLAAIAVGTALMLSMPSALAASDIYGQVSGVVVSSGVDLANATITLKHLSKGISRTVKSDDNGSFTLKGLAVGEYQVIVSKDGYQSIQVDNLTVKIGQTSNLGQLSISDNSTEVIQVIGRSVAQIDFESSQQGVVFTTEELSMLPVGEDLSSVALLAPGNSMGSTGIFDGIGGSDGRLVSSAGGSVAENGYYLNGFNITDIRYNAIISDFAWEAISQINVINGGIPAQYGRTVGGVTNMVAKSGSNEFSFGAKFDWSPSGLASTSPDFNYVSQEGENWENHLRNSGNKYDNKELSLWASGALIEDTAFFYVLYAPSKIKSEWIDEGAPDSQFHIKDTEKDNLFVNLDWQMFEDHALNFVYMNSQNTRTYYDYNWNVETGRGDLLASDVPNLDRDIETENTTFILSYTGYITDDLSVSATAGRMETDNDNRYGTPDQFWLIDSRHGNNNLVTNTVGEYSSVSEDTRDSFRIDFDWDISENHTIGFGYEQDETNSKTVGRGHGPEGEKYSRSQVWNSSSERTRWCDGGAACVDGSFTMPAGDYYWTRQFDKNADVDGSFSAYYIQDTWQVTEQLVATIGIRSEAFSNTTSNGEKWIDIDNQFAPRVELNYDILGDGTQKIFFNYGRYYQPVAPRVSERFVSPETDIRQYRIVESLEGSDLVTGDVQGYQVVGNGEVRPAQIFADAELEPMYLDGFNLGYEIIVDDNWLLGLSATYRNLAVSIEDSQVDGFAGENGWGVLQWCADEGMNCSGFESVAGQVWNGGSARFINPGNDLTIWEDFNGDGELTKETIPASYLGYPKAEREYTALTFTFDGDVTEAFHVSGSYTWSRSEGNIEGLVRSDNNQRDPGWTRSFDEPQIVEDGYGRLPNDRPHNFKIWGTYDLSEDLIASFNYSIFSGSPINHFGYHEDLPNWGAEYFRKDEQPVPRGTAGRTSTTQTLALGLTYMTEVFGGATMLRIQVENPFDWNTVSSVEQEGELWSAAYIDESAGETLESNDNHLWGTPTGYQAPRSVKLSVSYQF
jgi:hypothetical protein